MSSENTQVAVIGAGPGGYAAAFMAADLGLEVTLIDPAPYPGGVCLYEGCIPSKALLNAARVIEEARGASAWGISFPSPAIDIDKLREWKQTVVAGLTEGLGQLVQRRRIRYLRALATFSDGRTLNLSAVDGSGESRLGFEHAIVATGSQAVRLKGTPSDDGRVMDAAGALALADVPAKLLVVGGGYIGLELGSAYAAFGSRVTVVEMTPQLLPGVDRDLVRVLSAALKQRFEEILLQTTVESLQSRKDGIKVMLADENQDRQGRIFDRVLVAVGRRPRSGGLGLENTAVQIDGRGFIQVDAQRRTAEDRIFAIGDVVGEPMLAHKAAYEGRVAAEVIAGRAAVCDPVAIPAVVFTEPEIAWAGLTEGEAKTAGTGVKVNRFPWAASGRAATLGLGDGVTKVLVDPESERVLGVGIAGPQAGEMIAEAVVAMEMSANVTDLALSIHPHPTLSETLKEAAEAFHGTATHLFRPKRR